MANVGTQRAEDFGGFGERTEPVLAPGIVAELAVQTLDFPQPPNVRHVHPAFGQQEFRRLLLPQWHLRFDLTGYLLDDVGVDLQRLAAIQLPGLSFSRIHVMHPISDLPSSESLLGSFR